MNMDNEDKQQMVLKLQNISRDATNINKWIHSSNITEPPISSQMYKEENVLRQLNSVCTSRNKNQSSNFLGNVHLTFKQRSRSGIKTSQSKT